MARATSNVSIGGFRYENEAINGEVNGSPAFKPIPLSTFSSSPANVALERADLKDRGQRTDVSVTRTAVSGSMSGPMVTEGLDPFIESALQAQFKAVQSPVGLMTNGQAARGDTAIAVDGSTVVMAPGTVFTVGGTQKYTCFRSTATQIHFSPGLAANVADNTAIAITAVPQDLVNGEELITKTLEGRIPQGEGGDLVHERYLGCAFSNLRISQALDAFMQFAADYQGFGVDGTSAVTGATYPDGTTKDDSIVSGDDLGLIDIKPYGADNTHITADFVLPGVVSFEIANPLQGNDPQPVVNKSRLSGIAIGGYQPTITIEYYSEPGFKTLEDASRAREEVSLTIGPFFGYSITFPKCQIGNITKNFGDTGSFTASCTFLPQRETDVAKIDPYQPSVDQRTGTVRFTRGMGGVTNVQAPTRSDFITYVAATATTNAPAASVFEASAATSTRTDTLTLPTFTVNSYIWMAWDRARPDPTTWYPVGSEALGNQIGAISKQAGMVTIDGTVYDLWRTNGPFYPSQSGTQRVMR